jgi:hypothetical protein
MSRKRRARRNRPASVIHTRRRGPFPGGKRAVTVVALLLGLSVLVTGGMLARSQRSRNTRVAGTLAPQGTGAATPSKEYVFAGARLVATEEPTATTLSPPTGLGATTLSTTSVRLAWTAPAGGGVDHYVVERSSSFTGSYTQLSPNPTSTTFTDSSASSGIAYLYRVRSADSSNNTSSPSNLALATTVAFTNEPLQQQQTIVQAVHINELRTAVNAVRATAGLGAASWTNTLTPQVSVVKAIDVTELRSNLSAALTQMGFTAPSFTDPSLGGVVIKAQHIRELRQDVNGVL